MTLIDRIAAAQPEETRELIEEAWDATGRLKPGKAFNPVDDYWYRTGTPETLQFFAMLDAGAYLDAVLLMLPEGRGATIDTRRPPAATLDGLGDLWCYASTPRARAAGGHPQGGRAWG